MAEPTFQRILYIGDSGTGKTGSLTALLKTHHLHFLDFDYGTQVMHAIAAQEGIDDAKFAERLDVVSLRDSGKLNPNNPLHVQKPTAAVDMVRALDKWPTDESVPADWGPEHILVIDSLTQWGQAAYNWAYSMDPGANDPRRIYGQAQQLIRSVLSKLTSPSFRAHVIAIGHVQYEAFDTTGKQTRKAGPKAIGNAMAAELPSLFNNFIAARVVGNKRTITTVPADGLTVKTTAPFKLDKSYPLATGIESIWKEIAN